MSMTLLRLDTVFSVLISMLDKYEGITSCSTFESLPVHTTAPLLYPLLSIPDILNILCPNSPRIECLDNLSAMLRAKYSKILSKSFNFDFFPNNEGNVYLAIVFMGLNDPPIIEIMGLSLIKSGSGTPIELNIEIAGANCINAI